MSDDRSSDPAVPPATEVPGSDPDACPGAPVDSRWLRTCRRRRHTGRGPVRPRAPRSTAAVEVPSARDRAFATTEG